MYPMIQLVVWQTDIYGSMIHRLLARYTTSWRYSEQHLHAPYLIWCVGTILITHILLFSGITAFHLESRQSLKCVGNEQRKNGYACRSVPWLSYIHVQALCHCHLVEESQITYEKHMSWVCFSLNRSSFILSFSSLCCDEIKQEGQNGPEALTWISFT